MHSLLVLGTRDCSPGVVGWAGWVVNGADEVLQSDPCGAQACYLIGWRHVSFHLLFRVVELNGVGFYWSATIASNHCLVY